MTKEQLEKCTKFEREFTWAVKSNFVHMSATEFNEVAALFKEIMGRPLTRNEMTCNTCKLKAMKELADTYFQAKAEYEKEEREKEKETEGEPKVKKGGRPKKINVD